MSLLAVAVQFYAQAKIIASVNKSSFWPAPKVDSAIIKIKPSRCHSDPANAGEESRGIRQQAEIRATNIIDSKPCHYEARNGKIGDKNFFRVVHAGFSQPRKQLGNNLSRGLKIDRTKINETLKKIGLEPSQRAETLNISQWVSLSKIIK
jgi:16S rRNA (adenine1518-N6/adenine1519-N6)-dimethyltransferase